MSRELKIYTSLWAMMPHDDSGITLPYDEICAMVSDAGYDGMAIDLGAGDIEQAKKVQPIMAEYDLTPLIVAFPKTIEDLREVLIMAKDFGAPFVDVIGQVMPITVEGMIPVIRRWMDMADEVGIPVQFETHRNCITNDLFSTLSLLDAVPEMRLSADLSHYIVDREFKLPLSIQENAMMSRILERSDSFQGRVASRQQIQLQLKFPQHQKWVEEFHRWWREGFTHWRAQNRHGDCIFLCELGPPEYAMTNQDGEEMSNRWEEGLMMKRWAEKLWANAKDAE